MDQKQNRKEKMQAPSVKGVPAIRPNSPVDKDEPYTAPSSKKNKDKKYEADLQPLL